MKKLLSICFLSILLAAFSFSAKAQVSTDCCFWLENLQPETLTGLSNAPDGSGQLVLDNTMSRGVRNQTHFYKVRFNNNCNLPGNTKVSLDFKLYIDGQLVTQDPAVLSEWADFKVYTRWNGIATSNTPGTVNCGQMSWFGGSMNGPGTCQDYSNYCVGGYPGSMQPEQQMPWATTSAGAAGAFNIYTNNYDFFYLNFFEQSENIIAITWKQAVINPVLVVGLRERTNGTDYTQYFGENELDHIGGHQSCCGRLLAEDSIHTLVKSHFEKEVCDGSSFEYGRPIHTFDVQGDYLVVFGDSICDHFVIERLDTLHFFVRRNPQVVLNPTYVERCFGHGLTPADLSSYASFETPDAAGLTYKEIQWSTDNVNFSTTVPTPATEVGLYHYYVRQSNTYYNFLDSIVCEGPSLEFTYKVNPIPETPVVLDREDFYCVSASNGVAAVTVEDHAVASDSCHLVWSKDRNFATTISGADLIPDITVAGTTTYYIYQVNDTTGCVGLDLDHVDSIVVTVYANPEVVTSVHPTFVCQGDVITVSVAPVTPGSVYTYLWGDGKTTASFDTIPGVGHHQYTVTAFEAHDGLDADKPCQTTVTTIQDTVNPIPLKPVLGLASVDYCNETVADTTTFIMRATVGQYGTVCVWYDENKNEIGRGASYSVNVHDIMPATNINHEVKYLVRSYNEHAGCWSEDFSEFTFFFHQTPVLDEISASVTDSICPVVGNTVLLSVPFVTETTAPFIYTWTGSVVPTTAGSTVINIDNKCDSTYATSVYVTDKFGCVSTPKAFSILATDHTPLTLSTYATTTNLQGCSDAVVPAAYQTAAGFQVLATITNHCGDALTVTHVDAPTTVDADQCVDTLVRTYTITDHCGNSVDFVQTFVVKDEENPEILVKNLIDLDVVRVADCKYDAPATEVLMAALEGKLVDNCASPEYLMAGIEFYYDGTTTRFEGARDIFADETLENIVVSAKITDRCGNVTLKPVFNFNRPARMFIENGAAVSDYDYVCKQDPNMLNRDTVVLTFDPTKIHNAFAPYTFVWSSIPEDSYIASPNALTTVVRPLTADVNYRYVMTVTDMYGCVYTDTTNPVYVNDVITININKNTLDSRPWQEPICPNQQYNLTASCMAPGFWPPELFNFVWSQPGHESYDYSYNNNVTSPVSPNTCSGFENFQVLATRIATGCKAIARTSVFHADEIAPVVNYDLLQRETTVSYQAGCTLHVPDFTQRINRFNTTDNCVDFSILQVSQSPLAGTVIEENTPVIVTIVDPCGNSTTVDFMAKVPEHKLSVIASASHDAFCEDTVLTLTAEASYYHSNVSYAWLEGTTLIGNNNPQTTVPTADEDEVTHKYYVIVTDGNNCQAIDSVSVVTYRKPRISDITLSSTPNTYCDNELNVADGTITDTLTTGFQYKLSSDPGWHPSNFEYTARYQGTYPVDVMTNHGCYISGLTNVTVDRDTTGTVYATLVPTENRRCAEPYNGVVTVNNVAPNYTYTLVETADSRTATSNANIQFTQLYFGDYNVDVVTDRYCKYSLNTHVDSAAVMPVRPQYYSNYAWDCARPNGTLSLTNGGVIEGYKFELLYVIPRQIIVADVQDTVTFNGLRPGSYSISVETPMACRAEFHDFVVDGQYFVPVDPATVLTPNSVCVTEGPGALLPNGAIEITHPINNYTYVLKKNGTLLDSIKAHGTSAITFNNLLQGDDYTLTVYSEVMCSAIYTRMIEFVPGTPTFDLAEITTQPRTICATPNGVITINYVPGYTYVVTNASGTVETDLTSLVEGEYTITKTSLTTLCSNETTVTVGTDFYQSTYTVTVTNNSWCNQTQFDGALSFSNDSLVYTITNADFVDVTALNGQLPAGVYTISAVNTYTSCPAVTTTATINDDNQIFPAATPSSTANYICYEDATHTFNGTVTLTPANNGATIVAYVLGDATNTTGYFANLKEGDYSYTLISSKGCQTNGQVSVVDSAFVPEMNVTHTDNFACDTIWALVPGNIVKTRVPGNGSITFTAPLDPDDLAHYTYNFVDENLSQLQWVNARYLYLGENSYVVRVIDNYSNCRRDTNIVISTDRYNASLSLDSTDNNRCVSPFNGTIIAHATSENPTAVFTYAIGQSEFQNSGLFGGLDDAPVYFVTAKDTTLNCMYTNSIGVEFHQFEYDFSTSVINPNTNCTTNNPNGSITVILTGDNMNPGRRMGYSLVADLGSSHISRPVQSSNVFNNLPAGTYYITAHDTATGCEYRAELKLNDNITYPSFVITPTHNSFCTQGSEDGSMAFVPANDYNYLIFAGAVSADNIATNGHLAAGTYTVRATDPNTGCTTDSTVVITNENQVFPVVASSSTADYMCVGDNGTVTLTVTNLATDLATFELTGKVPAQATGSYTFAAVSKGTKDYIVTSSKGCSTTGEITVADSAYIYAMTISTEPDYNCANGPAIGTGAIAFDVTNPVGHAIIGRLNGTNVDVTNNRFEGLYDGTYNFRLTDAVTGCIYDTNATVESRVYNMTLDLASTPDTNCIAPFDGTISVEVNNQNPNPIYAYSLDAANYQASSVFEGLNVGKYGVTVVDSSVNCSVIDSISVLKFDYNPVWNVITRANYSCVEYNGVISINFTGMPNHTYMYSIDNGNTYQASNIFTGLNNSGTDEGFQIVVKDMDTRCVYTTNAEVADSSAAPDVEVISENYTKVPFRFCYGTTDGKLIANAHSDIANDTCFTYRWNNDCFYTNSNTNVQSLSEVHVGTCTDTVWVTSCLTGCVTMKIQKVYIDSLPVVKFLVDRQRVTSTNNFFNSCENDAHEICVEPTDLDSIQWNAAAGYARTQCIHVDPMPAFIDTTFCVMIWDRHGCAPRNSASITFHYMDTTHTNVFDTICAVERTSFVHNGVTEWLQYNPTGVNTFIYKDTLVKVNGCDSIVTYTVTLNGAPTIDVLRTTNLNLLIDHCAGDVLVESGYGIDITAGGAATRMGWNVMTGATPDLSNDYIFNINNPLTLAMNSKQVYAYVMNDCDTVFSRTYTLTVSDTASNIIISPRAIYCHLENFDCHPGVVLFRSNVNNGSQVTTTWQISEDQQTWIDTTPNFVVRYANNGNYVRLKVTNCCGDNFSAPVMLVVDTIPNATISVPSTVYCAGDSIKISEISLVHNPMPSITAPVSDTLYLGDSKYVANTLLQYADNGKELYYLMTNRCGSNVATNKIAIKVNDKPTVHDLGASSNLCVDNYSISEPTIDTNGTPIDQSEWRLYASSTATEYSVIENSAIADLANSGKYLVYAVHNDCGWSESSRLQLVVKDVPTLDPSTLNSVEPICAGSTLSLDQISVEPNNAAVTSVGYRIFGSNGWRNFATNEHLPYGNYKLCYVATNACGTTSTDTVDVRVNDVPVISGNVSDKVLCASSRVNVGDVNVTNWRHTTEGEAGYIISSDNGENWDSWTNNTFLTYGNYKVAYVATNDCGTVSSDTVNVVINDIPTLTGTIESQMICAGDVINFGTIAVSNCRSINQCSNHFEYSSDNGQTWSILTTNTLPYSANAYKVRYHAHNSCGDTYSDVVTITVNDVPVLTGSLNVQNICASEPVELGTINVNWRHSVTGTAAYRISVHGANTWRVFENGSNLPAGMYDVAFVATNGCGTVSTDTAQFFVKDVPTLTGTIIDVEQCEGAVNVGSVSVQKWNESVGTCGYRISKNGGAWSSWTNGTALTYGNYKVAYVATNDCGTTSTDTVDVVINAKPVISGTISNQVECAGTEVNVGNYSVSSWRHTTEGSEGYRIRNAAGTWSEWENNSALTYGNYKVAYIATNGCGTVSSDTVNVTVNDVPALSGTISDQTVCAGDAITFGTMSVSNWKHNLTIGNVSTYEYSVNDGEDWITIANGNSLPYSADPYLVRYRATNGCGSSYSTTVEVEVNDKPSSDGNGALTPVIACAGQNLTFEVPGVDWHGSMGTAKFQVCINGAWVDTTASMTFQHGVTYQVRYVASNDCGNNVVISGPVPVTVNDVPSFTLAPIPAVCEGQTFNIVMPEVNMHGATPVDTVWSISKSEIAYEEFDPTHAYSTDYNNGYIKLSVENTCGITSHSVQITIDTLPVPHILGDTTICHDGTAIIKVVSPLADCTYQWYVNGAAQDGATNSTYAYTPNPAIGDDVHHITVEVTDSKGCVSEINVNDGVDTQWGEYDPERVSVKITDDPRFVFIDENGNETHRLPDATTSVDQFINYRWTVKNPCGLENELVFVTFDVYRNGELLPADSIGSYFVEQAGNSTLSKWFISQTINYYLYANNPTVETQECIYDWVTYSNTQATASNITAMHNHFPVFNGWQNILDCIYLDLITSRTVSNRTAPVRQEGDYMFVYKLWQVNNINVSMVDYYDPNRANVLDPRHQQPGYFFVGGYNSLSNASLMPTLIMEDSLFINVTGEYQDAVAPIVPAPQQAVEEEDATITSYPNPTDGEVTSVVDGLFGNASVTVTTNSGVVIFKENIYIDKEEDFIYRCNLSNLNPGFYFIVIDAENGRAYSKVSVVR